MYVGAIEMKYRQTREQVVTALQLRAAGVPLDLDQFAAEGFVMIRQCGGTLENSVFDLPYGLAGHIISLRIAINRALVGIGSFRLELPWTDADTQWLNLGVSQRHSDCYRFPGGSGPEFEKELVINHFAGLSRKFRRGDFFQGFLLGFGSRPIPDDIKMGARVTGFLTVTDQFSTPCTFPISLFADRSQKNCKPPRRNTSRKGLFDEPDACAGSNLSSLANQR
jgi:hypothetical protein